METHTNKGGEPHDDKEYDKHSVRHVRQKQYESIPLFEVTGDKREDKTAGDRSFTKRQRPRGGAPVSYADIRS